MSVRLTDIVRAEMARSVLCWLATVAADGRPNVSPKEIFCADGDDAILIADILSPGSVRNIRANPAVCVSFIDVFRQQGFKIAGLAEIAGPNDDAFARWSAPLIAQAGPDFPVRTAIRVTAERIERIWPPSRLFLPERSADDALAATYAAYGVRPLDT